MSIISPAHTHNPEKPCVYRVWSMRCFNRTGGVVVCLYGYKRIYKVEIYVKWANLNVGINRISYTINSNYLVCSVLVNVTNSRIVIVVGSMCLNVSHCIYAHFEYILIVRRSLCVCFCFRCAAFVYIGG